MEKTGFRQVVRHLLPKRIKPHRILSGPLRGRFLVTSWYDYPAGIGGYTESGLLAWFRTAVKQGECWLDIGAHYGYTALALSELVGRRGHVWAFEPVAATAGHLLHTAQLNRLDQLSVLPMALGGPESLSLLRSAAVRGMAEGTLPVGEGATAILVARLDWLWPRLDAGVSRIDGVKIDVQGMELQVLRGMTEILRSHRPLVVVELHTGVDRRDVFDLLESVDYSLHATPIEPLPNEAEPAYADDRSYVFRPNRATRDAELNAPR